MPKSLFSFLFKANIATFHAAIVADNTDKICRILNTKPYCVNRELDDTGNTALLLAIKYASPRTVQVLLERGASPDQPNSYTLQTPLGFLAATSVRNDKSHEAKLAHEMASILLDYGAYVDELSSFTDTDIDDVEFVTMETPLITAVKTRNLLLATLFVERKANVNFVEKQFQIRPIHLAVKNGDLKMFDLLENAGALCRSIVNKGQNTLLHCFCCYKDNDEQLVLLERLIMVGCDVNAVNSLRRTPLMLAAKMGMVNTCRVLLDVDADLDKIDCTGQRAIDFAEPGNECYKVLADRTSIKKVNSKYCQDMQRTYRRKHAVSTYGLSMMAPKSTSHLNCSASQRESYKSDVNETDRSIAALRSLSSNECANSQYRQETDTKYKTMWEKLIETNQNARRTRDLSRSKSSSDRQNRLVPADAKASL